MMKLRLHVLHKYRNGHKYPCFISRNVHGMLLSSEPCMHIESLCMGGGLILTSHSDSVLTPIGFGEVFEAGIWGVTYTANRGLGSARI